MDIKKAKYIEYINELSLLGEFEVEVSNAKIKKYEHYINIDDGSGNRGIAYCANDTLLIRRCIEVNSYIEFTSIFYLFSIDDCIVSYKNMRYKIENNDDYFNTSMILPHFLSFDDIIYLSYYYKIRKIGSSIYYLDGDEKYTGELP